MHGQQQQQQMPRERYRWLQAIGSATYHKHYRTAICVRYDNIFNSRHELVMCEFPEFNRGKFPWEIHRNIPKTWNLSGT